MLGTSCSGAPEVDGPALSDADAQACADLVAALPDALAGQARVEVSGDDERGAAWGDPAFVLTCGVAVPEEFDRFSQCQEVGGVGWFVPPAQEEALDDEAVLTAVGFEPRVSLLVPAERRGGDAATALAELAVPVKQRLEQSDECA